MIKGLPAILWNSIDKTTREAVNIKFAAKTKYANKSDGLLLFINRPNITWVEIHMVDMGKLHVKIWEVLKLENKVLAEGHILARNLNLTLLNALQKV